MFTRTGKTAHYLSLRLTIGGRDATETPVSRVCEGTDGLEAIGAQQRGDCTEAGDHRRGGALPDKAA